MRLVLLSDTHNRLSDVKVPDGDVLIHAGDSTMGGTPREIIVFSQALHALPHKTKICIAGNHDWGFERDTMLARGWLGSDIIYLNHEVYQLGPYKVFGSPWTPWFNDWAFNGPRVSSGGALFMRHKWAQIPDDTNILITHGPPYGVLDLVQYPEQHVGDQELAARLPFLTDLRLHVCGHIHEGYGISEDGITVNASIMDDGYRAVNTPIVVDL